MRAKYEGVAGRGEGEGPTAPLEPKKVVDADEYESEGTVTVSAGA